MKRGFLLIVSVLLLFLMSSSGALACFYYYYPTYYTYPTTTTSSSTSEANQDSQGYVAAGTAYWKTMAKAQPDECYYGVGSASNEYPMVNACTGVFKRNDAYVWGMTQFEDKIFFGTASNVACLVALKYLGSSDAIVDNDYVCEMYESAYSFGDFRFPSLYMYTMTGGLQKLVVPTAADPLRKVTIGFRAAGVHPSGIVLIAGPMASAYGSGINMFAFSGKTGTFLGASNLKIAENIRNIFTTSSGDVYIGVGGADQTGGSDVGSVYKWNVNATSVALGDMSSLFSFELVGTGLDAEAAQLGEHEGRLFVTTWPNPDDSSSYAGLWMSPKFPFTSSSASSWTKVWNAKSYDPYTPAAKLYGGGALKSFGGYLYWGTMHVPGMTYNAYINSFTEPSDDEGKAQLAQDTNRSLSLFRGKNFGTSTQKIELLYGGKNGGYFRTYDSRSRSWTNAKNLMNLTPLYGEGGFNNIYANYTWSMSIYNNHLYVGVMDYSQLAQYLFGDQYTYYSTYGGDLYRFDSTSSGAVKISDTGMGNVNQYGIRTMAVTSDALILGTAGNANTQPGGGWEVIRLKESSWSGGYLYSGPYRIQAESSTLTNFSTQQDETVSEDKYVGNTAQWCGSDFTFSGNAGTYDISIRYYDPGWKSGSIMRFYVSGVLIASKTLTQSKGWYQWHIDNVPLSSSNLVELHTTLDRSGSNVFKVDYFDIVPKTAYSTPSDTTDDDTTDDDTTDDDTTDDTTTYSYEGDGNSLDLTKLQVGDIIMLKGVVSTYSFPGYTWAHCAIYVGDGYIVEAWEPTRKVPYSILKTASSAAIYRINTTDAIKQAAAAFALAQIGKPYDWSWITGGGAKDVNSSAWYCSELVWAAYKTQGIELDGYPGTDNIYGVTVAPDELVLTSNVTLITSSN